MVTSFLLVVKCLKGAKGFPHTCSSFSRLLEVVKECRVTQPDSSTRESNELVKIGQKQQERWLIQRDAKSFLMRFCRRCQLFAVKMNGQKSVPKNHSVYQVRYGLLLSVLDRWLLLLSP
jgi:hypothetical protein